MTKQHHCQICERVIKDKMGVIAHHGYKRPGEGWQTSSCYGARAQAYEFSNSKMLPYIQMLEGLAERHSDFIKQMMSSPPPVLTETIRDTFNRREIKREHQRPEGFDAEKTVRRGAYMPHTYECTFASEVGTSKRHLASVTMELKRMRKRLAEWKPIAAE